jgi:zinc protease
LFAKHRRLLAAACALATLLSWGVAEATPKVHAWQTANGAQVLFVAAPGLPMVDIRVVFDAGSARDGDHSGLASLTNTMLAQGAGDWSADQIAERVESVGAKLGNGSARDMAWLSLRTLTRPPAMETAIQTLAGILAQPSFRATDFERVRQNRLVALRQDEQDPGTVGSKAIYRAIFGRHPYAADPGGTLESLNAIKREELGSFHRRFYVAHNAVVAIVGDLDLDQAHALAEEITGGLAAGEHAAPVPAVPDLAGGVVDRLAFPSVQTHIYAGQPGISRSDPDYFPLYVGNHILGGSGLVSLLMEEIREKRGLSYSVYSQFLPMAERGPFLLGLSTKNAQAEEARKVLMATVARFRDQGPTPQELTAAVKNITGGFPLRIDSNADIVQYLAMIGFYGLPLDYLDTFTDRVSAVTADQIRDAFRRRLDPATFAVVIVGPQQAKAAGASG